MMVSQTGIARLVVNKNGERCWYTCGSNSKTAYQMDTKKHIELNPEAFEEGTEIRIFEPIKIFKIPI